MAVIKNIKVNAGDREIETHVNLLNQANELYDLLVRALPPGQLKEDALEFTARKKEEYVKRISS